MKRILYVSLALFTVIHWIQCVEDPKKEDDNNTGKEGVSSLEVARSYAMETQSALGSTLQKQIAENGVPQAIDFCNISAIPITDSMAMAKNAEIHRVTDKVRNPPNRASKSEIDLMQQMRTEMTAGNPPEGREWSDGNRNHYYFPIITNGMCLNCHGSPEENIAEEVLLQLREKYPDDQATGYRAGQLRGLWKITLSENQFRNN